MPQHKNIAKTSNCLANEQTNETPEESYSIVETSTRGLLRHGLTEHPRGWGVWLDQLRGDFLNDVPQLPRHLGLEDVKGLIRMQLTITLEVIEETVVGIPVPLKKKEEVSSRRAMGWSAATPAFIIL